ncbi:MAG: adenine deaminase [Bacteroidetes bacterium GWE2_29_8]|nr:MAG: adenine deaminase [Bacteroidetes bacterium GWE2_29_8]HBY21326.1 adenine deaminase [Clostridiales bacterium]
MENVLQFKVSGKIVDIVNKEIFKGHVVVEGSKIIDIIKDESIEETNYIIPGFIDSHVHIESSMLLPSDFARLAVKHGVIGVVADPHEIANVLGIEGIEFMIENSKKVPFKFAYAAPSCVPATHFETSGSSITSEDIDILMKMDSITHLGEVMNFPAVINKDPEILKMLAIAKKYGKPADGHAPMLTGDDLTNYINAGITTDHEATTFAEGEEKIKKGMKILIRDGSAVSNLEELMPLLELYPEMIMFCSDDKHPDDLSTFYINKIIKYAYTKGFDLFDTLRAASYNPIKHYNLNVGLLQVNDPADFIVINNFDEVNVLDVYIEGAKVVNDRNVLINKVTETSFNNFNCSKILPFDLKVKALGSKIKVIEAFDNQLFTKSLITEAKIVNDEAVVDLDKDLIKIVVYNRYFKDTKPSIGFIKNIGLKRGAFGSTVAHDSHNIIVAGTNDDDIAKLINLIIDNKGGLGYVCDEDSTFLPLPYGGLMSNEDGVVIAEEYKSLNNAIIRAGGTLSAPFMTLSFMALLVIPELKISDKSLFDVTQFKETSLFV